jgi:D-serine deaminase-like pyridoxal phosphate-dependent protein
MQTLDRLPTPALLLDGEVLRRNIDRMQKKAERLNVALRPHIKTHKCIEIAKQQVAAGAQGITVSTFYEAEQFSRAGFEDITWAFPMPPVYASRVADLNDAITFNVTIDSEQALNVIAKHVREKSFRVWLEIDCGLHRSGVPDNSPMVLELANRIQVSKEFQLIGILTHAGHSYHSKTIDEVKIAAAEERDRMLTLAEHLRSHGIDVPGISIGSTPTASVVDNLEGVTEIRPGNYVFYDYMQVALGTCTVEDCALSVLASVVSHQPGSDYFITDAGALALSKDLGPVHIHPMNGYGHLFQDYGQKRLYGDLEMSSITQEHGKVSANSADQIEGAFKVGDCVRILENHSCLTAAQFDYYYVVEGDRIVDRWQILRGRT